MKLNKLSIVFWSLFLGWVFIQLMLVAKYWDMPNHDDAKVYVQLATECIQRGTWYPADHNRYDDFVFGPGYVNLLIATHRLFGSYSYVRLFNLVMNIGMLFGVCQFTRQLFSMKTGYYAGLLYMLLFSNLYVSIALLTDLPFAFLLLLAILLAQSRSRSFIAIAGILFALANWFKPLAIVFLSVVLLHFFWQKRRFSVYLSLLFPLILTVFIIGQSAKSRTGFFIFQAVSGGYNLAMSSFDKANGLVNFSGFSDSTNTICLPPQKYTYIERDRLLKEHSIDWILQHPDKYFLQLPFKLIALYCEDTWSERVKPDMGFRVVLGEVKGNSFKLVELIVILFLKSLVFYFVLTLYLYYTWKNKMHIRQARNVYLLIPIFGTAVTVLFVITSRYHYPYVFIMLTYAAAVLEQWYSSKTDKIQNEKKIMKIKVG